MNEVPVAVRTLAAHILSHEAGGSSDPDELADAAERVETRLRGRLSELIGLIGYTTLLARALRLAQLEIPALGQITVNPNSGEGGLSGVRAFVEVAGADNEGLRAAAAGLTAILAHVIELLSIFIGEDLALRLVREGWPEIGRDQIMLEG